MYFEGTAYFVEIFYIALVIVILLMTVIFFLYIYK